MKVVGLRKKCEKNDAFVKFKDNSVVLDKFLDSKYLHVTRLVLVTRRRNKNLKMTLGL